MTRPRKPLPLQLKLTLALVLIVMTPLAVSAYLIGQLGKAAANVATGEAESRIEVLEKSFDAYHALVRTTKDLHKEISLRLAQRPDLIALDPKADLAKIVNVEPGLRAIALVAPDGRVVA
ncbi:MAG TPA: hypothetical protein VN253_25105, partial [Kofleriaceae bacterium]|nr:hypothetical protein [Kofleriaceae bacterium]